VVRVLAEQASDGIGGLLDLEVDGLRTELRIRLGGGANNTVADVLFDEPQAHGMQGLGDGGHLGEDVDAVGLVLDHPLQPAHLTFDALEALEIGLLVLVVEVSVIRVAFVPGVLVHAAYHTPVRYEVKPEDVGAAS